MITKSADGTIVRSGDMEEQVFRIKSSAKAFKILSSALYANKVKAIIRELSANAFDAHKEAGNLKTPFDLCLPNNLSPVFRIRDYGTGISPDDIKNVYTTYFESPKTNSNDYIGCMGLGSKTPLCYTDSFLVTSYFNGKKYIYSVFLNEHGCPTIALFNEEDTTEHNGLEVSFNVEVKDFYTFGYETEQTLSYYNPQPNISGQPNVKLKSVVYSRKGKEWGIRDPNKTNIAGMQAVMGNIAYPITNSSIANCTDMNIDIFFKIGSFEVTASREDISYEPETIRILKEKIELVKKELQHEVSLQLQQADSYWKAVQIFATLQSSFKNTNVIHHVSTMWNKTRIESTNVELFPTQDIRDRYAKLCFHISGCASYGYTRRLRPLSYLNLTSKYIFVLCDETYAINKRVAEAEAANPNEVLVVFNDPDNQWEAYKKEMGIPDTIVLRKLSEFTYTKSKIVADKRYFKSILEFDHKANTSRDSDYWKIPTAFDFSKGGVYVIIDRYKVNHRPSREYIKEYFYLLQSTGFDPSKVCIYGIKEKEVETFKNDPNWLELAEYCKVQFESKYPKDAFLTLSLLSTVGKQRIDAFTSLSSCKTEFQDYHLVDHLPAVIAYQDKQWGDYNQKEAIRNFSRQMYKVDTDNLVTKLNECEAYISKYCPLWATFVNHNYGALPTDHIKQYLKTFLPKK